MYIHKEKLRYLKILLRSMQGGSFKVTRRSKELAVHIKNYLKIQSWV